MRIFVTGASGWIGSALVPELISVGHQVLGLARSDASAKAVADMGAEVLRGDLNDSEVLRTGALDSDGIIHLAFIVPSVSEAATQTDAKAIETFTARVASLVLSSSKAAHMPSARRRAASTAFPDSARTSAIVASITLACAAKPTARNRSWAFLTWTTALPRGGVSASVRSVEFFLRAAGLSGPRMTASARATAASGGTGCGLTE
jgi:NAD(P)-dependent dehydrogenase (short-subunit alcohol dehydrogenase family)